MSTDTFLQSKKGQRLGKQGTDAEWRDGDDDGGNCSGVIRVME